MVVRLDSTKSSDALMGMHLLSNPQRGQPWCLLPDHGYKINEWVFASLRYAEHGQESRRGGCLCTGLGEMTYDHFTQMQIGCRKEYGT